MTNPQPQDTPLTVEVHGSQLVIRIGIETLAWAAEHQDSWNPYDEAKGDFQQKYTVTNALAFAKDVRGRLLDEEEDGSTPIGGLLDRMCNAVVEYGDESVGECPPMSLSIWEKDSRSKVHNNEP
jgi:hypothetical protein